MPENKVRKYFRLVECWAWCSICRDMVALNVNKKEIISGLELGIYTKKWMHQNPFPDYEDPEDHSGEIHTIFIYINDVYDITGVKSFFGDSPSYQSLEAAATSGEVKIPIVVKEIPELAVFLGLLTPDEYKVLKVCDGMNTIEQVAEISENPLEKIEAMMLKLRDKGLVDIIRREY